MLEYAEVEKKVVEDFDKFDFAGKPMEKYCAHNRKWHIQMATRLALSLFWNKDYYIDNELEDFIHGLNYVFFNGVAAGQNFEWERNK